MATLANLAVNISANTADYRKGLDKAQKKTSAFKKSIGGMVSAVTGPLGFAAVGAAVVAFVGSSVKAFAAFEKGMAEVGTLSAFTAKQMKFMSDETRKMAITFGQSLDVLTKARYDIVSAGFADITEQTQLLTIANKAAVAGVTDVSTATDLLTSALNAYGLQANDAEMVSDIFFATVKAGKTTITELNAAMGQVMPVARAAGVSLEELGAAMATTTAAGINTVQSATGLKSMLVALAAPTKEAAKVMAEMGIKTTDAHGKMLPFLDVIKQFEGMPLDVIRRLIPSEEAAKTLLALAANTEKLEENLISMGESAGATGEAFTDMTDTLDFKMKQLGQAFKSFAVTVGEKINDIINFVVKLSEQTGLTDYLMGIVQWFKNWWEAGMFLVDLFRNDIFPAIANAIGWVIDLGVKIKEWIIDKIKSIFPVSGKLIGWLKRIGKFMKWLTKPINLVRSVIIGLKMTYFSLMFGVGKVITGIANLWEWLKSIMAKGLNAIKSLILTVLVKVLNAVGDAISNTAMAMKQMGLPTDTIFKAAASIQELTGQLRRSRSEVEHVSTAAQHHTDVLGLQAVATQGLAAAVNELNQTRRAGASIPVPAVAALPTPAAAQGGVGGGAGAAPPGAGGGGAGAGGAGAGAGGFFPLGGPFEVMQLEEAATEATMLTQAFLEQQRTFWAQHYETLFLMAEENRLRGLDAEEGHEATRLEKLQQKLEARVATEAEFEAKIAALRIESMDAMHEALKAGIIDYFAALGQGANGMKALKGILIGIAADTVAGIAQQWGILYFLQGAAEVAASIWPPNIPRAAGGLKMMAAGAALMTLAGVAKGVAAGAGGGGGGGGDTAATGPAAGTAFGAAPTGGDGEGDSELPGSGIVVNVHVEGHIVDTQKFVEEVIAPNLAKAVGRGAAFDGQYNLIAERE